MRFSSCARIDKRSRLVEFFFCIAFQYVAAVESALAEIANLFKVAVQLQLVQRTGKIGCKIVHQDARRDKLPMRGFLRGQLGCRARQRRAFRALAHLRLEEGAKFLVQPRKLIHLLRKNGLHLVEYRFSASPSANSEQMLLRWARIRVRSLR